MLSFLDPAFEQIVRARRPENLTYWSTTSRLLSPDESCTLVEINIACIEGDDFAVSSAGVPEKSDQCPVPDMVRLIVLRYGIDKLPVCLLSGNPWYVVFLAWRRYERFIEHFEFLQVVKFEEFLECQRDDDNTVSFPAKIFHHIQIVHHVIERDGFDVRIAQVEAEYFENLVISNYGMTGYLDLSPIAKFIYCVFE